MIAELLEDELSLDGRVPRTLRLLLFRPGALTRQWMAGRRTDYIRPLRLYLLASFVMFGGMFIASEIRDRYGVQDPTHADVSVSQAATDEAEAERARETSPIVLFAAVPLFALLLRLAFRRPELLYVDYLTTALHAHAFAFFMLAGVFLLEPDFGRLDQMTTALQIVLASAIPLHLLLSLKRVFDRGWLATLLSTILLFLVHFVVLAITIALIALRSPAAPDRAIQSAHELYQRAMSADSAGQAEEADALRTEAIVAYRRLESHAMAPHVRYHLARLQLIDGDTAAALATAQHGLIDAPRDPLLLGLAAFLTRGPAADSLWRAFQQNRMAPLPADTAQLRAHAADVDSLVRRSPIR